MSPDAIVKTANRATDRELRTGVDVPAPGMLAANALRWWARQIRTGVGRVRRYGIMDLKQLARSILEPHAARIFDIVRSGLCGGHRSSRACGFGFARCRC